MRLDRLLRALLRLTILPRSLNYPPVDRKLIEQGGNRAGSHSDYGSVTLLFQDMVGGLEVQDKQGNFIPAVPVPETVVVNIVSTRPVSRCAEGA